MPVQQGDPPRDEPGIPAPLRLLAASARLRGDRPAPLIDGLQAGQAVGIEEPTGLGERLDLDGHRGAPPRNAGDTVGLEVHVAMPVRGEEMDAKGPGIRGESRRVPGDEADRRRPGIGAEVVAARPGVVADVPGAAEPVERFPERQRARGPYRDSSAGEGRVVE